MPTPSRIYAIRHPKTRELLALVEDASSQAHAIRAMARDAFAAEAATPTEVAQAFRTNVPIVSARETPAVEPPAAPEPQP